MKVLQVLVLLTVSLAGVANASTVTLTSGLFVSIDPDNERLSCGLVNAGTQALTGPTAGATYPCKSLVPGAMMSRRASVAEHPWRPERGVPVRQDPLQQATAESPSLAARKVVAELLSLRNFLTGAHDSIPVQ